MYVLYIHTEYMSYRVCTYYIRSRQAEHDLSLAILKSRLAYGVSSGTIRLLLLRD